MMYSELLRLTDQQATYEQFLKIDALYMENESMTKKQAAALWKRLYGEKRKKPLPVYLKAVKNAIRDFKDNREWLDYVIEKEVEKIDEKLEEYRNDCFHEWTIKNLEKQKEEVAYQKCEEFGNDAMIRIVYKDGSECIASGAEIVGGLITPRMQHIVYACYMDAYVEYDTFSGILVDDVTKFFGDLSTDEGIEAREAYYGMIEEVFKRK